MSELVLIRNQIKKQQKIKGHAYLRWILSQQIKSKQKVS